jgi:predicted nuclease of restriction endonuclease-like RecB superfamily
MYGDDPDRKTGISLRRLTFGDLNTIYQIKLYHTTIFEATNLEELVKEVKDAMKVLKRIIDFVEGTEIP